MRPTRLIFCSALESISSVLSKRYTLFHVTSTHHLLHLFTTLNDVYLCTINRALIRLSLASSSFRLDCSSRRPPKSPGLPFTVATILHTYSRLQRVCLWRRLRPTSTRCSSCTSRASTTSSISCCPARTSKAYDRALSHHNSYSSCMLPYV